jgi:hypothetical protein
MYAEKGGLDKVKTVCDKIIPRPVSQTHPMKAKAGRFGTQPTGSRYRDVV